MKINFECRSCKSFYNYEVGEVSFDDVGDLKLEKYPLCYKCKSPKWYLSEYGQSQVTQIFMSVNS